MGLCAPRGARGLPLRSAIFWVHLAAGVLAGGVVLVMAATGVLLAYERQLTDWAANRHRSSPPTPGAERLPLDTLLARARPALGNRKIASIGLRSDPAAPVAIGFDNRQSLLVDPYTGARVGDDAALRAFFVSVQRWHRALGADPRSPVGKGVTGAANLAFLALVLTGLYLWWPRQPSRRAFRAVAWFVRGARGKARDWNWHHTLGFWSAPALVAIVGSAVFMSYAWPGALVRQALGEPAAAAERDGPRERGAAERPGAERRRPIERPIAVANAVANLDAIRSLATRRAPGWTSMQIRWSRAPRRPVTITIATGPRPDQRQQASFDAASGELLEWRAYADEHGYRRFRAWIRPVHTGEAGGPIGQTVAALVSAAAVVLVWTGLALALRRLRGAARKRDGRPAVARAS